MALQEVVDRGSEENVRVVEVDNGGGGGGAARGCGRRSTCGAAAAAAKGELYQKVSPTPSALTEASARTMSGRLDDYSFSAAASEASGRHHSVPAAAVAGGDHAAALQQLFPKNYMANTESSRAKARSQSAPRQRTDSLERQPSRRKSGGGGGGAKMQRSSSSHAAAAQRGAQFPWPVIKLDTSSASLKDSECGSTSSVLTAATVYSRTRSLVGFEVSYDFRDIVHVFFQRR
jgi:hypothetical protein